MGGERRFCTNCGAMLEEGGAACRQCGMTAGGGPVSSGPPEAFPPTPAPGYAPYPQHPYLSMPPPPRPASQGLPTIAIILIAVACSLPLFIFAAGFIASFSIPMLLSARQNAIQEKARNSLTTIVSAQAAFYSANGHYATDLAELGAPPAPQTPYIDALLATGTLPEMTITCRGSKTGFTATAVTDSTSIPDYQTDETGVIKEM